MRKIRRSRSEESTMEVTPYFNVYSTMLDHKHSQIVVNNGIQTNIQEHTAYDDKQDNI